MADLDGLDIKLNRPRKKKAAKAYAAKTGAPMEWGMKNRLSRVIKPSTGRTVMLAVDHGYFQGVAVGLEDLRETLEPLLPYADALMPTRGGLRTCVSPDWDVPVVLRASSGNSLLGELSDEDLAVSIEDAIRLNVAAVAISIYVGAPNQHKTLLALSKMVDEATRYGIPVLAVTAVGKDLGKGAKYLSMASRIAAELGATFVKTYYCEGFERVVDSCPVPIVMAGGKKIPELEALELTSNAIKRGAAGVDMGRNIFQADDPAAMIQSVSAIVHEGISPQKALKMYEELKASAQRKARRKK